MLLVSIHAARPSLAALSLRVPRRRAYSTPVDGGAPVPKVNKIWDSVDDALRAVKSGDTVLSGGASGSCSRACDASG